MNNTLNPQIQNPDYDYSSMLNLIINKDVALPFLRSVHGSSFVTLSRVSRAWNSSIANYALLEPHSLGQKLFICFTGRDIESYPGDEILSTLHKAPPYIDKYRNKALTFPVLLSLFINHEDHRIPAHALREMQHVLEKNNPQGLAIMGSLLKNLGKSLMDRSMPMPDQTQELGISKFLEDSIETRQYLTQYFALLETNWQTKNNFSRSNWNCTQSLRDQIACNHHINDFDPLLIINLLYEMANYADAYASQNYFGFAVLLNILIQHKNLAIRAHILDCIHYHFLTKSDLNQNMSSMIKPLLYNLGKSLVKSGEAPETLLESKKSHYFSSRNIILLITLIVMIIAIAYAYVRK